MWTIGDWARASLLTGVGWHKSSYSNACGSCIEMAQLAGGRIAVRNSRHPGGPVLIYRQVEVAAFIHGAKVGEFSDATAETMV